MNAHQLDEGIRRATAAVDAARRNKVNIALEIRNLCKDLAEELSGFASGRRFGEALFKAQSKGGAGDLLWSLTEVLMEFAPSKAFKVGDKLKNSVPLLRTLSKRFEAAIEAEQKAVNYLAELKEKAATLKNASAPGGTASRTFNRPNDMKGLSELTNKPRGNVHQNAPHPPKPPVCQPGMHFRGTSGNKPKKNIPENCAWVFYPEYKGGKPQYTSNMSGTPQLIGYWQVCKKH